MMEKLKSNHERSPSYPPHKYPSTKFTRRSYLREEEDEEEEEEEDVVVAAAAAIASSSGTTNRRERLFFSSHTTKSIMEEAKSEKGNRSDLLCEKSVMLSMYSTDPYCDFRASMEDMVTTLELREWHSLQELLHCYLKLNQRKNHKAIVQAFMDLLLHLILQNKEAKA